MAKDKLVVLILAAGYSKRMGDFKPLLKLNGEYVIAHAIKSFREGGISDIRVVIGYRNQDILPILFSQEVTPIYNENFSQGMFSSVKAGLNSVTHEVEGFFLLPGDMPLVNSSTIKKLVKKQQEKSYSVIYPTYLGKRGHPPLITKKCFGEILVQGEDSNLRQALARFCDDSFNLPVADQGILIDLDIPEDFERLSHLLS